MRIAVCFNVDAEERPDAPGREARGDIDRVARAAELALVEGGHLVERIGVGAQLRTALAALERFAPDLVVNLCESIGADARAEMCLPAFFDAMGITYTGNDALCLGLALHKDLTKAVLRGLGLPTAPGRAVRDVADARRLGLPFPLIVKPSREDASTFVDADAVVHDEEALVRAVSRVVDGLGQPALVERYIAGREIYVPLLDGAPSPLPITEVHFGAAFDGQPNIVSYAAKWLPGSDDFRDCVTRPAVLEPAFAEQLRTIARAAFAAVGGRDYGRVDFRVDGDGNPFILEVNPNCDLAPDAGFSIAATSAGLPHAALIRHLVETAALRLPPGRRTAPDA